MTVCDVCGHDGLPVGYAGLRRCPECSHVWADLSMDPGAIHQLYQRSYFFGDEYSNYVQDRRIIEKNFAGRLATLRRFLTPAHRVLFEIGCAYGFFLDAARQSFASVGGIDVSEDAVRFAREELGLEVSCGDLIDAGLPGQPPDVVCLWDTIEHLAAPRRYLEHVSAGMPAGSLMAITTGDIGSLNARIQKGRWRLIHPPTHLHYFTVPSLTRLLDRCGFDVVHVEHAGMYRSVRGMIDQVVSLRWRLPRLGRALTRLVPPRLDAYMNLYDIMYIVASRR
jgi:2-polyprenyl-3-methyl-5-hydroxy-6-metoxy-1,4-benzoquinol methylase